MTKSDNERRGCHKKMSQAFKLSTQIGMELRKAKTMWGKLIVVERWGLAAPIPPTP